MNDLCTELLKNSDNSNLIELGDCTVPWLFWADDLILISEIKRGYRNYLIYLTSTQLIRKMKVNIEKPRSSFSINKDGYRKVKSSTIATIVWKM